MLFKTRSAAVYGIEAYLVDVEVNISTGGNGQVVIVGLPDTAVRESRNRVLPAIRNNGFGAPYQRIVINLGPADVKKEGSAFDLPMAIGILGGYGLLAKQDVSDYLMVGELTLDGKLRPVKGVLSIALQCLPATARFRICLCRQEMHGRPRSLKASPFILCAR
jgi:magnesium chelatase family protein